MSIEEFDKLFGIATTLEEEQEKFVNRIENTLFDELKSNSEHNKYKELFVNVCYQIGVNSQKIIDDSSYMYETIPMFSKLTNHDFHKTLRIIVAIYYCTKENYNTKNIINQIILAALDKSHINLGVKWNDGLFYQTGDKILDKELVDESLEILKDFPNEKKDLNNALENYMSKSLYGVVENCYLSVEGLSRKILCNNKTLIDNKPELIQLLQFSNYWNKIFANYLNYANEYRRHAGENRHDLKPLEVESFLYLTCLIIRATIRSLNERK